MLSDVEKQLELLLGHTQLCSKEMSYILAILTQIASVVDRENRRGTCSSVVQQKYNERTEVCTTVKLPRFLEYTVHG